MAQTVTEQLLVCEDEGSKRLKELTLQFSIRTEEWNQLRKVAEAVIWWFRQIQSSLWKQREGVQLLCILMAFIKGRAGCSAF